MRTRELERLMDLLAKWHEAHPHDHELRDYASELRAHIDRELEERGVG